MLFLLISLILITIIFGRPSEEERVRLWYERNNTWPPNWQPESSNFKKAMELREQELQMIPGADERWENYMQYTVSRLVPRFTENGFDLVQTPDSVQKKLKRALDAGLRRWDTLRDEQHADVVYTPIPSKFIDLPRSVLQSIQEELLPLHEAWSGLKLQPTSIYGIRMNRNGSSLAMHYDKTNTHVISSIIHVDHEYDDDDEPWLIEIEDHDGVLHSYSLEAGQMLFYESASCLHGRRGIFKGKHYSSIFNHYQPVDKTIWNYTMEDVIASVPPHWHNGVLEQHGSRWCGQGLTIDSRVTKAAPPRIIKGEVVEDIAEYYSNLEL